MGSMSPFTHPFIHSFMQCVLASSAEGQARAGCGAAAGTVAPGICAPTQGLPHQDFLPTRRWGPPGGGQGLA